MTWYHFLKLWFLFNFSFLCSVLCKTIEIKYKLTKTILPHHHHEETILTKEAVTSKKNTFSIQILSEVPVLKKGMLQISEETYYFWVNDKTLEKLEPGVFDDQNITEGIELIDNELTVISTGTFKKLKIRKLSLVYNKITHLEENAISDLPNLTELNLSYNQISHLDGRRIVNTPRMWDIVLAFNNFTKLSARMFSFMKTDGEVIVGLGGNQIEEIDPGTFDGINVFHLSLNHNALEDVPGEIFSGNDIMYFKLDGNQVKRLPEAFFSSKHLLDVNLTGNPLECDVQERLKKLRDSSAIRLDFDTYNC